MVKKAKRPRKKLPRAGQLHVVRLTVRREKKRPVEVPALVPSQYAEQLAAETIIEVQHVGPLLRAWQQIKDFFREV